MNVGSVAPDVFKRIEDYARQASGGDASTAAPSTQVVEGIAKTEQHKNIGGWRRNNVIQQGCDDCTCIAR